MHQEKLDGEEKSNGEEESKPSAVPVLENEAAVAAQVAQPIDNGANTPKDMAQNNVDSSSSSKTDVLESQPNKIETLEGSAVEVIAVVATDVDATAEIQDDIIKSSNSAKNEAAVVTLHQEQVNISESDQSLFKHEDKNNRFNDVEDEEKFEDTKDSNEEQLSNEKIKSAHKEDIKEIFDGRNTSDIMQVFLKKPHPKKITSESSKQEMSSNLILQGNTGAAKNSLPKNTVQSDLTNSASDEAAKHLHGMQKKFVSNINEKLSNEHTSKSLDNYFHDKVIGDIDSKDELDPKTVPKGNVVSGTGKSFNNNGQQTIIDHSDVKSKKVGENINGLNYESPDASVEAEAFRNEEKAEDLVIEKKDSATGKYSTSSQVNNNSLLSSPLSNVENGIVTESLINASNVNYQARSSKASNQFKDSAFESGSLTEEKGSMKVSWDGSSKELHSDSSIEDSTPPSTSVDNTQNDKSIEEGIIS